MDMPMKEEQLELVMTIVREQLEDYLAPDFLREIVASIERGILDNVEIVEEDDQK